MYVETLVPYPVRAVLPLTLRLGHEIIKLDARVVFTDPGIGMGLEFEGLTSSVHHKLEALVQSILNSKDSHIPQDRRVKGDRRTQKHHESTKYRARDLRKRDRRQHPDPPSRAPVEVEFSRLKSIFFRDRNGEPSPREGVSHSLDKEVIVTFRDGEEIRGTLTEVSPEHMGFFIDLQVSEKISYTVYVIKTAVKGIVYL
jgi:small nuclear ribonucleoprotein (snRNP)-like protein